MPDDIWGSMAAGLRDFFTADLEDVYKKKYGKDSRYPTLRESYKGLMQDALMGLGVDKHTARRNAEGVMGLADWSPIGVLTSADDAQRAAAQGDIPGVLFGAMGAIPAAGKGVKAGEKAIRAYHGSPHDFPPEPGFPLGRFRDDRIGTGEGTQQEGIGHYLGQATGTGEFYSKSTVKDVMARVANDASGGKLHPDQQRRLVYDILDIVDKEGVDALADYEAPRGFEAAWKAATDVVKERGGVKGKTYEVNVKANLSDFLDLEKPLSEQQHLLPALRRAGKHVPGGDISRLKQLAAEAGPDSWYAAQVRSLEEGLSKRGMAFTPRTQEEMVALRDAGIPGAKFLDDHSRPGTPNATHNLVVFDPKIIEIVRKFGIAAALGAGLISEEMARQMQQQGIGGPSGT